jgi:twitching motility two-component system response regulator PilG
MSGFIVATVGLQPKDARLLDIVLSRAPNRRFEFKLVDCAAAGFADIAIIDADHRDGRDDLQRLRGESPEMVEVYISDSGALGESNYKIPKKSLVLQCFRLLENIADAKLKGDVAGSAQSKPAAPPPPAEAPKPVAVEAPKSTPLVLQGLVVDDSQTVRTQLEVTLSRCGLKVDLAANGEEARTLVQTRVYDLIFLDVVMPGINGYELCREIRHIPSGRHVSVVMLTSRSSPFDRARGALAGCDTYLTKPVTVKDFYAAVHKSLTKRYTIDELAARGYKRLG